MLSAPGRAVLALGAFCWFAAVFFGSLVLYPVGRRGWWLAGGARGRVGASLGAAAGGEEALGHARSWSRGDDVTVELVLARGFGGRPLPAVVAHESVGRLGEREVELRPPRAAGGYAGAYRLGARAARTPIASHRCASRSPTRSGWAETTLAVDEQQALVV